LDIPVHAKNRLLIDLLILGKCLSPYHADSPPSDHLWTKLTIPVYSAEGQLLATKSLAAVAKVYPSCSGTGRLASMRWPLMGKLQIGKT
jgi:hypothetical protein